MTCEEFGALDTARQKAVVRELIADGQTPFTEQDVDVATTLADSVCAFLPDNLVVDVLLGGG